MRKVTDDNLITKPAAVDPQAEADRIRANLGIADKAAPTVAAGEKQAVEAWFAAKKVARPVAAALMAHTKWGIGRKLTEAEFDTALGAMLGKRVGEV